MVLEGFFKFTERVINKAKVAICTSLPRFVSKVFGNTKFQFVVLEGVFKITEIAISIAKLAYARP